MAPAFACVTPLVNAAGTVIALVNPAAASSPTETVTYDPSGTPSASGSANGWPFLYHGMEHESVDPNQFYYSGNGAYYSAQIMRSMSMTGALGRRSPSGDASGIVGGGGMAISGMTNAAALAKQLAFQDPTAAEQSDYSSSDTGTIPLSVVVQVVEDAFDLEQGISDLIGLFGGGSPDYPPNYWVQLFRATRPHGGPHPLYTAFIGIAPEIVPGMDGFHPVSAGGAPSPNPPLLQAGYRLPGWANPTLFKKKVELVLGCLLRLVAVTRPLRFALEACATIGEVPAGPVSAAGCSAIVAGVLGPPTAALVYLVIRNCIRQYEALG